jgi:hypothetical protein
MKLIRRGDIRAIPVAAVTAGIIPPANSRRHGPPRYALCGATAR